MRSDKLIQLDRPIPPSRDTREAEHIQIDRQIAEYLAQGGTIKTVSHTENHSYNQPIRRNKRAQIAYKNRMSRMGRE